MPKMTTQAPNYALERSVIGWSERAKRPAQRGH